MSKSLLIVAVLLSVLTAGLGFLTRSKIETARGQAGEMEAKADSLAKDLATTKQGLEQSQEELAAVTAEKEKSQTALNAAKADVDATKTQLANLQNQINEKEEAFKQAKDDLAAKDTKIAELEAAAVGATAPAPTEEEPSEELKIALEEQKQLVAKLEGDLSATRAQIEELRTREQERRSQTMRVGLEGRVLAVNPAWNFVVLSLGDRNGVVGNAEMLVKRGTQLVGKVRITSVEPSTSIADIVANSVPRGMSIQPGDNVIYVSTE